MYRIKSINKETNKIVTHYGFTRKAMKIIHFLTNEYIEYSWSIEDRWEIISIDKLPFSLKTLKKCLTNHCDEMYN